MYPCGSALAVDGVTDDTAAELTVAKLDQLSTQELLQLAQLKQELRQTIKRYLDHTSRVISFGQNQAFSACPSCNASHRRDQLTEPQWMELLQPEAGLLSQVQSLDLSCLEFKHDLIEFLPIRLKSLNLANVRLSRSGLHALSPGCYLT